MAAERPIKRFRSVSYDSTQGTDDRPQAAKVADVAPSRQPLNINTKMYVIPCFHYLEA